MLSFKKSNKVCFYTKVMKDSANFTMAERVLARDYLRAMYPLTTFIDIGRHD